MKITKSWSKTENICVEFDAPVAFMNVSVHSVKIEVREYSDVEPGVDPIGIDVVVVGRRLTSSGQEDKREKVASISIYYEWRYHLAAAIAMGAGKPKLAHDLVEKAKRIAERNGGESTTQEAVLDAFGFSDEVRFALACAPTVWSGIQ